MNWSTDIDNKGNTTWEAPGPYTDEFGAPEFYFRIRQDYQNDTIWFVESSDDELLLEEDVVKEWLSLEKAQKEIENWNNEIIEAYK